MLTEEQREYQRNWYHANKEKRREVARNRMKAWRQKNPELARANNKRWKERNPDYIKDYLLKKQYGITLLQKDQMFANQGSKCAICKSSETNGNGWHVDHCHSSKKVRGILCNNCNLMIGHAKDSAETLLSAAEYIKR